MTFHVGQRVECIDDSLDPRAVTTWYGDPVVYGEIYTVSGHAITWFGDPGVLLVEAKNGPGCYRATRFRPLVERKTDIGWAQKIVKDVFAKPTVEARRKAQYEMYKAALEEKYL